VSRYQNSLVALQRAKEAVIEAETRRVTLARTAERLRLTTLFKIQHDTLNGYYSTAQEAVKARREHLVKTAGEEALLAYNLRIDELSVKVTVSRTEITSLQQELKTAVYSILFEIQKARMMLVATTDYEVAKRALDLALWK
jgi:hypothetical protein